jgi:hypothetical protein
MRMPIRMAIRCWLALALTGLCAVSCTTSPDPPASFVVGLRVLAATGEPPQVDPGGVSQVTVLAVDTGGRAIDVAWSRCALAPLAGEAVNADCVTAVGPPTLEPIGSGLTISAVMPPGTTAASLGLPDATNGVYLPLVAQVTDGVDAVTTVYRLRLGDGTPPNMNPEIASIEVVDAAGVATAVDPAAPLVVHAGEQLTLEATYTPGSAQTYIGVGGASATEVLSTSWFCTAGALSVLRTSAAQPQTVLNLTASLPETGQIIDLWAVVHDERGGVGYTHRSLALQ